jgi:hypothetical protein
MNTPAVIAELIAVSQKIPCGVLQLYTTFIQLYETDNNGRYTTKQLRFAMYSKSLDFIGIYIGPQIKMF